MNPSRKWTEIIQFCLRQRKYVPFSSLNSIQISNILLLQPGSGLAAASKVVEVGSSSMTVEERKRFESVAPKKRYNNPGYYTNYGAGGKPNEYRGKPTDNGVDKTAILKALGIIPTGNFNQNRGICYNCQRPGHYASNCSEPPMPKKPRFSSVINQLYYISTVEYSLTFFLENSFSNIEINQYDSQPNFIIT